MADPYLAIAAIANDESMVERMNAAAAQQSHLGNAPRIVPDAEFWVNANKYVWASSPGWGDKWASALAGGIEDPGKDESVITDADILATVQALGGPLE
jgi:hypothetical protein